LRLPAKACHVLAERPAQARFVWCCGFAAAISQSHISKRLCPRGSDVCGRRRWLGAEPRGAPELLLKYGPCLLDTIHPSVACSVQQTPGRSLGARHRVPGYVAEPPVSPRIFYPAV